MGYWLVGLNGDRYDLQRLTASFERTSISIVEEPDGFYLRATNFDQFRDIKQAAEVLHKGQELVPTLVGAYRLRYGDYAPIKTAGRVIRVEDDGERHAFAFAFAVGRLEIQSIARLTVDDGNTPPPPNPNEALAEELQTDEVVATALRHYGHPDHRFANLYKVLDTITDDIEAKGNRKDGLQAIADLGWATKAELNNFTGTANNYSAIQDEARHGLQRRRPFPPHKKVPLAKAEALIGRIIQHWLEWRG